MAFTSEQLQAIHSTGKNITVAASAGSGKTTVLVERIMKRVMQDHIPLDRFLAMTFTEAAASEMKSRLFDRLTKTMKEQPENAEYCKAQLVLLSKAQISTIHSFCLSVIKENYAYIGMDIQRVNTIISLEEEQHYFQKAFQDTVKYYEAEEYFPYLKAYFSDKVYDTSTLYKEVQEIAKVLREVNYEEYYTQAMQTYTVRSVSDLPKMIKKALFSYLLDHIDYLRECIDLLIQFSEEPEKLYTKKNYLVQMEDACVKEDYSLFLVLFHGFTQVVFPPTSEEVFKSKQKELRSIEDSLLSILFNESQVISDLHAQWPLVSLLLQMSHYYNQRIEYYKQEASFMDFDDMEHLAYKILSNYPEVAQIYQQRYIDILVDEYQDSSTLQDKILSYITTGDNIFRVGDVKQSIYSFRNAIPELLQGYVDRPSEKDEVIFLRHNFRSNSQIIDFVNGAFYNFMNLSTMNSNFHDEDVALVGMESQETNTTCIDYHVLLNDLKKNELLEDMDTSRIRAEYIADEIIAIKQRDKCKWSDFVVLVRNNERKIDLKRAFTKRGVPNFIDSKEGFYKSTSVTIVTSFIQWVVSPDVDNYFAAVALSPFYQLTDNDLAKITLRKRELGCSSYYEYALTQEHPVLSKMIEDLGVLQSMLSLRDILLYMYNVSHYYDTYTTHGDRTNLDALLEKACLYESTHSDGLEGFASFITSLKDFKSAEALSINTKEDVVRVMTVHQSKGLQFSYVFYWGKEQANYMLRNGVLKNSELGIFLDHRDQVYQVSRKSLLRSVCSHIQTKKSVEEEIRVIYVALTRPKQKLIMTTMLTNEQFELLRSSPISTYELLKGECYGKWLLHQAYQMDQIRIKSVSTLQMNSAGRIHPTQRYTITPLPEYPHTPLTQKPSVHTPKLHSLQQEKAMQLGTMLHRMLEIIDFTRTYTQEDLKALAAREFQDHPLCSKLKYSAVLKFIEHDLTQSFKDMEIFKEYPFYDMTDGQLVHGVIDLLVRSNDHIYIVDYKSDISTDEELVSMYTSQLMYYKQIIEKIYPKTPITVYIYSTHSNKYIEI
ncbi:MAG: hypothetical protein E7191_00240 [Erysipelotrichaceae bacterium]|nr:hypothetical protein [Erysipelotrichaceae bacterium]